MYYYLTVTNVTQYFLLKKKLQVNSAVAQNKSSP